MSSLNYLLMSKSLVVAFVSSVTFWYCVTPLLVQPHPGIVNDLMTKTQLHSYIKGNEDSSKARLVEVENWTKWRLYVNTNKNSIHVTSTSPSGDSTSNESSPQIIYAGAKDQILLDSKAVMNMEWRPEYEIHVQWKADLSPSTSEELVDLTSSPISVHTEAPLLSFRHFGIYDHFRTNIKSSEKGNREITHRDENTKTRPLYTIQILPRFLFGIPYETIQAMYGMNNKDGSIDLSKLPIVGIFSDSPSYDRFIIQAYMNLVTMSVIFLLWANNPPETLMGNRTSKSEHTSNGASSKENTSETRNKNI